MAKLDEVDGVAKLDEVVGVAKLDVGSAVVLVRLGPVDKAVCEMELAVEPVVVLAAPAPVKERSIYEVPPVAPHVHVVMVTAPDSRYSVLQYGADGEL